MSTRPSKGLTQVAARSGNGTIKDPANEYRHDTFTPLLEDIDTPRAPKTVKFNRIQTTELCIADYDLQ